MGGQHFAITEWTRILKGGAPWSFLLQVTFRVFLLYVLIIFSMRLIGKRMGPQLTRNDMAALVSLAAAVGIPMQSSTRGVLPALVVAGVIVGMARLIAWWSSGSQKFERLAMDDVDIMVKDGRLQIGALRMTGISREIVFAQLRSFGIDHLGKVRRLYLEANGIFTLQTVEKPEPGLSLFPGDDIEMLDRQRKMEGRFACGNCGHPATGAEIERRCADCGALAWRPAVLSC